MNFVHGFFCVAAENTVVVRIQLQVVRLEVREEIVRSEYLGDLYQLIVVIVPVEEGLLSKIMPANMQPRLHMSRE